MAQTKKPAANPRTKATASGKATAKAVTPAAAKVKAVAKPKQTEEPPYACAMTSSAVAKHPAFQAVLEKAQLTTRAKELAKWAQVVIELVPSKKEMGCRLGGDALLPAAAVWPVVRWSRKEIATWPKSERAEVDQALKKGELTGDKTSVSMALRFLGSLDFAELAPLADGRLPKSGSLRLFLSQGLRIDAPDLTAGVAAAGLYVPDKTECKRRAHPPQPEEELDGVQYLVPRHAIIWYDPTWSALANVLSKKEITALRKASSISDEAHVMFVPPVSEAGGLMPPEGHAAILRLSEADDLRLFIGDAAWVTWVIAEADLAEARFDRMRASIFIG